MKTRNHRLVLKYDGTPFAGWQVQADDNTVQGHVERALVRCWGEKVTLYGSGRTDAGVHAEAQVANFKAPGKFRTGAALRAALNHWLPAGIRVIRAGFARDDFHARFSARGKEYWYRIYNHPVRDPFEVNRSWYVARPLDVEAMRAAAAHFVGKHDFASFTSNPGYERETTVRVVTGVTIKKKGHAIELRFRGEGFLYRMVRNMVGALVKVGLGRMTPAEVKRVLDARRRSAAPNTAPACGLYLRRVFYGGKL